MVKATIKIVHLYCTYNIWVGTEINFLAFITFPVWERNLIAQEIVKFPV